MILHIKLFPREEAIINRMKEQGLPVPECIRQAIRQFGKEEVPEEKLYARVAHERLQMKKQTIEEKEKIKHMTETEYAEQILRGIVEGPRVKFMMGMLGVEWVPLAGIKNHDANTIFWLQNHFDMLDRKLTYPDGRQPDYDWFIKEWKETKYEK